jgi:hypothetical protein
MNTVTRQLSKLELTEATRFVLPMLYTKDRNDNFFITKNFENCFIGDGRHPELGKKIFLLYNYQMTIDYVKFEHAIELLPDFSTDYDDSSQRQVMYVFDIPEEHKEDFKYFLKGEYSNFSEELKEKILKFWRLDSVKENLLYSALYKTDFIKEKSIDLDSEKFATDEYWPKPVLTREIFMNPN